MERQKDIELSIVATCYNDAELVPRLVEEIKVNAGSVCSQFEIILVNDGSQDNTEECLDKACAADKRVKALSLTRNFGQQIAMSAGLRHASGKYVLIMDGDLQNPPDAIPLLYKEILKGFDVVYAVSTQRNSLADRMSSAIFWFLVLVMCRVRMVKNQLMMKIMTKEFVERFNQYVERTRTVSDIVNDIGDNHSVVNVLNRKRSSGRSNYGFFKRFSLMIDVLIALTSAPLNMMIYLGMVVFAGTVIVAGYDLYVFFTGQVLPGYTSIILSIFFFGSIHIMLLGFIGRYLASIYKEVRCRPLFYVRKTANLE
jgi:polyisoprenyl-phosphate glycosyltransferase